MTDRGDYQGVCLICGTPIFLKKDKAEAVNVESIVYRSWFGQKTALEGGMWLCLTCLEKINKNLEANAGGPFSDN